MAERESARVKRERRQLRGERKRRARRGERNLVAFFLLGSPFPKKSVLGVVRESFRKCGNGVEVSEKDLGRVAFVAA